MPKLSLAGLVYSGDIQNLGKNAVERLQNYSAALTTTVLTFVGLVASMAFLGGIIPLT